MPAPRKTEGSTAKRLASGGTSDGRAVVTLPPPVAAAVRRMAADMGGDIGPAEVVRRGLILLDLYLSLPNDEELVIRNKKTQALERIRLAWDTF